MDTKVTEVTIIPLKPRQGLVGLASCVIDDKIYIGSIGIYTRLDGSFRLTYPNKKFQNNSIDIAHPIKKEVGDKIEREVVAEYERLMSESVNDQEDQQTTESTHNGQ